MAFLKLDGKQYVVDGGGKLNCYGLDSVKYNRPIGQQLEVLAGLLPVKGDPLVLLHVNLVRNQYANIHVVDDGKFNWVVLVNSTVEGHLKQFQQRGRLSKGLVNERARKRS